MFKSTNNLLFYSAPYELNMDKYNDWMRFQIGTCHGLWTCNKKEYKILAVLNDNIGNGHFQDVIDWFENSCKRDNRALRFVELMNPKFKEHLITKRGFKKKGKDLIKHYV